MELYHASNMIVRNPVIINRFSTLDFGTGFYTTTNREQAESFALKVFQRRGHKKSPVVNVYKFDETSASRDLEILAFDSPNEEWLNFVVQNRKSGRSELVTADIIMGPVANDDVFETVTLYEAGQLNAQEAVAHFKVKQLYDQVLFCNMKALSYLAFVEAEEMEVPRG